MLAKLCLITDRNQCNDIIVSIEEALKGGIRFIQLREKDLSSVDLYNLALKVKKLTDQYQAHLFINDRIDIALAISAAGVHVGKNSLPIPVLKNIIRHRDKFFIGYSAHSLEEALRVEREGADFITFSPIFQTPSKQNYGEPQGLDILKEVCHRLMIPVYALGGVKVRNIQSVLGSGAYGVALISEILQDTNPKKKVESLLDQFKTA